MMCSFKEDPNDMRRFNFITTPNGSPKVLKRFIMVGLRMLEYKFYRLLYENAL